EHGRVGGALDHPVVGRVGEEPAELDGVGGGAVLVVPGPAETESLVADHVEEGGGAHHGPHQVGALGEGGADEEAAVAAAVDPEPAGRGPAGRDERLAGGDEVVEAVLLVLPHAVAVPGLALLRAAPDAGHGPHTAPLDPGGHGGRV